MSTRLTDEQLAQLRRSHKPEDRIALFHDHDRARESEARLLDLATSVALWSCEDCGRDFAERTPVKCAWCKSVRAAIAEVER